MVVDKVKVEKGAKEILDKFAKALDKIGRGSEKEGTYVDREEFERVEKEGQDCDVDFKKRMLENAPNSDDDFIIAETGAWK